MIWLTWRQHRKQVLFTVVALAVLAVVMIPTGLAMHHSFDHDGISTCLSKLGKARLLPPDTDTCDEQMHRFTSRYTALGIVGVLFIFVPLLVGLFWGAPLVAGELEHGTHRLVWTQGISRRRWALVKFGLLGAWVLALAVVYGLGMSWWFGPLSQTVSSGRFATSGFDIQGLVPIGYTLFAVALGIFAGTVWQKVLPAMAVTLVGFLVLRIALVILARPRYLAARAVSFTNQQINPTLGDWVLSFGVRNAAGKLIQPDARIGGVCPPGVTNCGMPDGNYNWERYQPGSRFWLFQGIETGIFVALAGLLIYLALRRINRIA
jgi:hypothetical protein